MSTRPSLPSDSPSLEYGDKPLPTLPGIQTLGSYMLELINHDRTRHGISRVAPGSNEAAQLHAEDMWKHKYISHWTTDGQKPYMAYTVAGGRGVIGENIATSDLYADDTFEVIAGVILGKMQHDPAETIRSLQWGMMYDDAGSDWGHTRTTLSSEYEFVNIGVAYDESGLYLAQHFEANRVTTEEALLDSHGRLSIRAVSHKSGLKLSQVLVFEDEWPVRRAGWDLRAESPDSYGTGGGFQPGGSAPSAIVIRPVRAGYYYENLPKNVFVADEWSEASDSIKINAQISAPESRIVYTIALTDADGDVHSTHSIFFR